MMNIIEQHFYELTGVSDALFTMKDRLPLTNKQIERVLSIKSTDELDEADYDLIDENATAAIAYHVQLELMEATKHSSALGNIVELLPRRKIINAPVPVALTASTDDAPISSDSSIHRVSLSNHGELTIRRSYDTNPMTGDVIVRFSIEIDKAIDTPVAYAWIAVNSEAPLMIFDLPAGEKVIEVIRVFNEEQWQVIQSTAFNFVEVLPE